MNHKKHKVEAIDYLRGLSILAITIIHVVSWRSILMVNKDLNSFFLTTDYIYNTFLFGLRDILEFSVVTLVLCSGFSLYMAHKEINLSKGSLMHFYKKRFQRILLPWWIFLIIYFCIHWAIHLTLGKSITLLTPRYVISSFLLIPGGFVFSWLIALMLMLALLYPFLVRLYNKYKERFIMMLGVFYLMITLYLQFFPPFSYPVDSDTILNQISIIDILLLGLSFVSGWTLVYSLGFYLEELYKKHLSLKKELNITFLLILFFVGIYMMHKALGFSRIFNEMKFPPTPFYILFGLATTFLLLTIFFTYRNIIHKHVRKFLEFFSTNSFWVFLWCGLTASLIYPILSIISFPSVYVKFGLDLILNIVIIFLLVIAQKKITKFEEKHHF